MHPTDMPDPAGVQTCSTSVVFGRAGPSENPFESSCIVEGDLFFDMHVADQPSDANECMEDGDCRYAEFQRASIASVASTECPISFAADASSFGQPSASSAFWPLQPPRSSGSSAPGHLGVAVRPFTDAQMGGELMVDLKSTSRLAQRAQTLAGASAAAPMAEAACCPTPQPPPLPPTPSPPPPLPPAVEECEPSVGSRLHAVDACTPCKFYRGRRGCKDGVHCQFCHHKHEELTYSGIRRLMRKKGLERQQALYEDSAPSVFESPPPPHTSASVS